MEFRILGPLEVDGPDGRIAIDAGKVSALLELLLLRANEVVSAERLVDTLWGDEPPDSAEHAIEVYVSRLRRALGADRIETRAPGYRIRIEPGELDLQRFEALTAEANRRLADGDPAQAVRLFREAEALWRGPALADLRSSDRTRADITHLDELRLAATEARIDAMLVTGQHAELVPELDQLVADQPFRERLVGQHMLALYRSGRQVDALEAFQRARRALDEDLGLEPSPALQQLQVAILRQDPGLDSGLPGTLPMRNQAVAPMGPAAPQSTSAPKPTRRLRLAVALGLIVVVVVAVAVSMLPRLIPGGPGSTPSNTGLASASAGDTGLSTSNVLGADDQQLLDRLPGAVRDNCAAATVEDGGLGNVASLRCVLPPIAEAELVWFDRFSDLGSLNTAFDDLVGTSGAEAGDCASTELAVDNWEVPDVHHGRVLCYSEDGEVRIAWTYEGGYVLGRASRQGDDWKALLDWWRRTAIFLRR